MILFVCVSLQSQSSYTFQFYTIFTNCFNWIRKISLEKEICNHTGKEPFAKKPKQAE